MQSDNPAVVALSKELERQFADQDLSCGFHVNVIELARAAIAAHDTALTKQVETLREGLNAILDRAPERDQKWFGMTAKDIALFTLAATEPNNGR